MSWKSKIMVCFPGLVVLALIVGIIRFAQNPSFTTFLFIPAALYLFPLLSYRVHNLIFPLYEGKSYLSESEYSPWWGGHQIQLIYYACPWIEAILRVIPGTFSWWLRLWGANIGKNVYWTPNVEIDDRSLVDVSSNVVFGHKVEIVSHVAGPRDGKISLYSKRVKIGKGCFIGAGSRLGPGAVIEDGAFLPVLTDVYINQRITKDHKIRYKKPTQESS